uniref:Uncharacterized protein n=1 Tax=Sander lucioperca TaxID=283035 RepID=A0A8D0AXY6_SANLU
MSASYPTPVYRHTGRGDFRDVYEPAEDSPMCVSGEGLWLRSAVSFSCISGWTFTFDQCVLFFQRAAWKTKGRKGLFYLITIADNDPGERLSVYWTCGLRGESCLSTRAGNERLSILRFHRS